MAAMMPATIISSIRLQPALSLSWIFTLILSVIRQLSLPSPASRLVRRSVEFALCARAVGA